MFGPWRSPRPGWVVAVAVALAVAVAVTLGGIGGSGAGAAVGAPPGRTDDGTVLSNGVEYRFVRYTPSTYDEGTAVPLVVVVHGCQTTAEQMQQTAHFDELAEEEGFVVLYPDVDESGREAEGELHQCWKFLDPAALERGQSDAGAIADMTRATMTERAIDPERVYAVGVSAGGLMTAVQAAAYPELYAAVGLVATAGYANWTCFGGGEGIPVTESAERAFEQLGDRARVVPLFVIGSTGDAAFPAECADHALEQGLRTNNLVISGDQTRPLSLEPATVTDGQVPDGHAYTVSSYEDPAGCLIAEKTIVEDMPHAWSGGRTGRGAPGGPDGTEIAWSFFQRYTRSSTAMPCAEIDMGDDSDVAADTGAPADPNTGDDDGSSGAGAWVVGGAVVVVVLVGGGVLLARRRG